MTIRTLSASPSTEHLKKQAKSLMKDYRRGDSAALERVEPWFTTAENPGLQAMQLVIAREHGFPAGQY